jgi:hypothetical protein
MGSNTLWWGGCCWDSFALAHLLDDEPDVLVATRCPGCGQAGAWVVDRHDPPEGVWLAHFLVPVAHMWDDVVHTCNNQRLFCSAACIRRWLERSSFDEGAVMDLATLWRLASRWYEGRLDRGYVRREPAARCGVPAQRRPGRTLLGELTRRPRRGPTVRRARTRSVATLAIRILDMHTA